MQVDAGQSTAAPSADFDYFAAPEDYRRAAAGHARDGAFHSSRGDGFWVLSTYAGISAAFRDEAAFSVSRVSAAEGAEDERWVPLTLGGRAHHEWRAHLAPWFTPQRVRGLTPVFRENARRRIDAFADRGGVSFSDEFARPYALENLMLAVGWPVADLEHLLAIDVAMIRSREEPDPRAAFNSETAMPALQDYVARHVARRRAEPVEGDLTSATFDWEVGGEPVGDADRASLLAVLFLAGVDSTVNHLANAVQHLAVTPADRRRVVAEPEGRPRALEEFLRVNSCMYPGRLVARAGVVGPAAEGETVLLPLALANHDPSVFPDPGRVDLGRERNPHIAFGTGHHQCLGAALARAQILTAWEEWHARIPEYRLADGSGEPRFLRNTYDLRLAW
ncbi:MULTISPECIES: cytochrome P450 [Actinosynnema]|uniref:cytochrome P450 n=1 Tax=Actinosynnema TaxID=40566 RepID=UPI0020A3FB86|nr:cytochrome P450 [Actinosynnema pretiosum]MCP2096660.1 Cytochrome P450 [Actinosynnema pretiosum]